MKQEESLLHLDYPLVKTLEKEAWEISLTGVQYLPPCNYKEADTRIMYHCISEHKPTAVIASYTDIFTLLVDVFTSRLPDHDWFLWTKKNQFVNVSKIQKESPTQVCSCEYCVILKNTYTENHLWTTTSDCKKICGKRYSTAPLRATIYRYSWFIYENWK